MLKNIIAATAIATFAVAAQAAPVSVDFSTYGSGVAVTDQVDGFHFSLIGGPGPTTAPTTNGYELTNSVYSGDYPTATILSVVFSNLASNINFVFDPAGYCGDAGCGRGDTYYTAFDASGNVLETGQLGSVTSGYIGSFSVAAANVAELQFNNGTNGTDSWWFGLASLSADENAAKVPEPASLALVLAGLAGTAMSRRKKAK